MAGGQLVHDILGSQRSLVDKVTLVNALRFPFIASIQKGPTIDNVLYEWPVDQFEAPEDNAVVDGKDVDTFDNAAEDYAVLQNRIQWLRDTAFVSKLSQEVQNQAGVRDKKAYAIRKKLEKLWRDIETMFCSDNEAQIGTALLANKCRGMGQWILATAQSVYPVPTDYLTPAGNIHSGTIAQLTETALQDLLASIWTQTGEIKMYSFFVGSTLKRAITDFTNTQKGSTNVMAVVRTYNHQAQARSIINVIDRYEGDFGKLELIPTHWNAYFTSAAANLRRGYIVDTSTVQLVFKQMPKVMPLPDLGGGPRFAVDAIVGLRVLNPKGLGAVKSTS